MLRYHEQQIIGGLLKGIVTAGELKLSTVDFQDYKTPFSIIRQIESEGLKPDAEIVYQRSLETEDYFTLAEFKKFVELPVSASTCFASAKILKQESLKTDLTEKLVDILGRADEMSGGKLLDRVQNICEFAETNYREVKQGFKTLKEIAPRVKKVYEDLNAGISFCVPTLFDEVDDLILDGFSRGDTHLIVGFTGSGKSSLALNFARNQAKAGYKVGIVSREMSDIENIIRLQSADTRTPRWYVRKGLYDVDCERLVNHLDAFSDLPIMINTETSDVESLQIEVRILCETDGLDILYVDYLNLLKSSNKHTSRANEVQYISRTLKEIAMNNKIPVVNLCQFNRGAGNSSVFEIMHQLKESSGLEQDASTIMFVEVEQTQERVQIKPAKVTVLKNRNGMPFIPCELEFIGELFTFRPKGEM